MESVATVGRALPIAIFGRLAIALVVATVFAVAPACARNEADAARDSAELQRLLAEVRPVLPAGWQADISPNVPRDVRLPWRQGEESPCLVVWRSDTTPGEPVYPGMPGRSGDEPPPYVSVRPRFQLTVTRRYSLDEFQQAAARNADRRWSREEFCRRIPGTPSLPYKGNFPPPPSYLKAVTTEQQELVRQYALIWLHTEPKRLPTHHYEKLSLIMEEEHLALKDPAIAKEYDRLRGSVLQMLTAYRQPGE